MSYADRNVTGSRAVAVVLVAIILAVVGYGFVTGLAFKYIKKASEKLSTFDVQEPPPPPEELPPPPPPEQTVPPPPVYTPPAIVQTNAAPPPIQTTYIPPPPAPPPPVAPPAPPPPPRIAKPLSPKGNPAGWVTNDDYPAAAQRAQESGTTGFRLDVGPDGRVTNCSITQSSGSSLLDSTACNLLKRRARFNPAMDENGQAMSAAYINRFRWVLQDE